MSEELEVCTICGRSGPSSYFEAHHLFPGKHRRIKVDRQEDTIRTCRTCGDQIHLMFDNNQLRTTLDTLEALRDAMKPFIQWVRQRPIDQKITMKQKKRRL